MAELIKAHSRSSSEASMPMRCDTCHRLASLGHYDCDAMIEFISPLLVIGVSTRRICPACESGNVTKQIDRWRSESGNTERPWWLTAIRYVTKQIQPPKAWMGMYLATLEILGLTLLVLYFIGGIVIQNVGD